MNDCKKLKQTICFKNLHAIVSVICFYTDSTLQSSQKSTTHAYTLTGSRLVMLPVVAGGRARFDAVVVDGGHAAPASNKYP
jgi:hypothetical protein